MNERKSLSLSYLLFSMNCFVLLEVPTDLSCNANFMNGMYIKKKTLKQGCHHRLATLILDKHFNLYNVFEPILSSYIRDISFDPIVYIQL